MDKFNIRDIENLTGIKAHTFRIWEKRYNFPQPKRKESSHRYYDNDDLKYILKISYLYHNGYKISRIVKTDRYDIDNLITSDDRYQQKPQLYINRLIASSVEFDEDSFEATLALAIERFGFESTVCNIIYPYFNKIGFLWVTNNVIPAQEHFASNLVRNKMISMIDSVKPEIIAHNNDEVTLLFTPEAELHELPLLFAAYLYKKYHKKYVYHGADIPVKELEEVCKKIRPTRLHFHLITNFTRMSIDDYLKDLTRKFPDKKIIMSGPLAGHVSKVFPNCIVLHSLEEKIKFISA